MQLLGGALLSGASGPYLLERTAADTLWVHNQSRGSLSVAFREDTFELDGERSNFGVIIARKTRP